VGVQTFDDALLVSLKRIHSGADAMSAIKTLKDAGYSEINIDLIFGHSGVDAAIWLKDLETVLATEASSCTFHPLAVRSKTALERKAVHESEGVNILERLHAEAIAHFQKARWVQTSAISFSENGVHNPLEHAEAAGQPTIGFGAGSRSYYAAIHTSTVPYTRRIPFGEVLKRYHDAVQGAELPIANHSVLNKEEQLRRRLVLQMHHCRISKSSLVQSAVGPFEDDPQEVLKTLLEQGYFEETDEELILTPQGCVKAASIGWLLSSKAVRGILAAPLTAA
jgi:oxygen-independent coproporphyrinogen-3 oxidase